MKEMSLYYDGVRVGGVVDVVEAAVCRGMPTASLQLTDAVRWDASRPLSPASFAALRWSMDLPFGGPSTITNLTLSDDGSLHWQRSSSAVFLDRLSQQIQGGTEPALSAAEITALTDVLSEFSWKTYPDEAILIQVWRLLSTSGANDLVIKTAVGLTHSAHARARAGAVSYLALTYDIQWPIDAGRFETATGGGASLGDSRHKKSLRCSHRKEERDDQRLAKS